MCCFGGRHFVGRCLCLCGARSRCLGPYENGEKDIKYQEHPNQRKCADRRKVSFYNQNIHTFGAPPK